ncbi:MULTISPECIES: metallophosphoesterase [unclassified Pseudoalteromonas]|uniref:metallophosphoesterase n=1 Tax=unclassified Pseudoalteromonas TaxID=194690 RepID=UPI000B3CBB1C|nr:MULTISPECIES: metallophosphoesterase [unclassified Pseudoalteromonas]MDN3376966.1 metallophosphoesterase [Pseudoalteromonas sp. APC 3893]MDN3387324.1 metallophosphoesterase [Pseudoalteromonas sp. APC 4017]OUS72594.1 metallophosphatase [Pseudoalteromonas sp. A601]
MSFSSLIKLPIFIATLVLLNGCGGDDTNKDTNFEVEETGLVISANNGLVKSFDNNLVQLSAPANSVTVDTSFIFSKAELDTSNKELDIVSPLYTFRPQNLEFKKSITIKIDVTSTEPQQMLTIVQLVDGLWQPLTTITSSSNSVSALMTSFGTFAVQARTIPTITKNIGPTCTDNQTEQTLRFIHVADLHARFGFKEQYFSRIKSYYNNALTEQPYTLFTNGGDDYEKGTVAEQTSLGVATVEAIKAMKFDVRVVGNHDYAWGPQQLLEYANDDHAIVLASNTRYAGNSEQTFDGVEFSIVQVGCLKVGFFGMTSVPWNELDQPIETAPIPDFIANFKMNWEWQEIAEEIVGKYSQDVDFMVMLSHLGEGTDTRIAQNVPGIDLVLGGHTHGGENYQLLENGSIVIQPNFFAQGLTDLTLTFDSNTKELTNIDYETIATSTISTTDEQLQSEIDSIMGKYAPDANTEIAISENYPTAEQVMEITALSAQHQYQVDAVLFDSAQVQTRWTPGTLTQEDFHNAFKVERQPSNTPGFSAIYQVTVSGSQLKDIVSSQPDWVSLLPESINDDSNYTLALQKGPAFNGELFFNDIGFTDPALLAETWELLDKYARYRTSQCLHIDTDKPLNACQSIDNITVWNFNDASNPFKADYGPSTLNYYDPNTTNWGPRESTFDTTTSLEIDDLIDGPSGVMAFSDHAPNEGLIINLNTPANGDFAEQGLVSDYTIVMDIYWPFAAKDIYRALMQTNIENTPEDDADIFINPEGGLGKSTSKSGYFGATQPDTWHRIAFVFYTAPSNGVFEVYVDGELAGVKTEGEINSRWALNKAVLLLTDDDYETEPGYLNALLYAGRSMTRDEIKAMGGAQQQLQFIPSTRELNQTVERHYQNAPTIMPNLWLEQRSKFFNNRAKNVNK